MIHTLLNWHVYLIWPHVIDFISHGYNDWQSKCTSVTNAQLQNKNDGNFPSHVSPMRFTPSWKMIFTLTRRLCKHPQKTISNLSIIQWRKEWRGIKCENLSNWPPTGQMKPNSKPIKWETQQKRVCFVCQSEEIQNNACSLVTLELSKCFTGGRRSGSASAKNDQTLYSLVLC